MALVAPKNGFSQAIIQSNGRPRKRSAQITCYYNFYIISGSVPYPRIDNTTIETYS